MSLTDKSNPTAREYVVGHALSHLGLRLSAKGGAVEKLAAMLAQEAEPEAEKAAGSVLDSRRAIEAFLSQAQQFARDVTLFAVRDGENAAWFSTEPPQGGKKKCVLVLRARAKAEASPLSSDAEQLSAANIDQEVLFMEFCKTPLEGINLLCNEVFMPVLGNPLNMIGWSDLVSKDLMDKFHVFLAYTSVTLGHAQGSTILPLPPTDVTSSEKTSSKDKSQLLEQSVVHWTKQIRTVLRLDPETALKDGDDPPPTAEIEFWKNKSQNLDDIAEQLGRERVKKVLKFLEQNKSTYTGPFSKQQKEVSIAREEARENWIYLQTLDGLFRELIAGTGGDLNDVADLFVPIMHTILLIWKHSQHYNTPSRLVVLIREICNAIIARCRDHIDGPAILAAIAADDTQLAHEKLAVALDVCARFKEAYFEYKAKAKNQWKITTNALFVRLDAFSERCQDIMHLTSTIIQFSKLEKIEIGNTKGSTLSATVKSISERFQQDKEEFQANTYDIMDISDRRFDDDFYKFRQRIKELERRLASTLTQGFDDCDTLVGKFKLLDSFEGLLNRPIIQDELEKKHITLLELYKQDLKAVGAIFMEGKALVDRADERAPIPNNLPPIAGALNWTAGLLERIKEPMDKLSLLSASIQDREEYKDVQKLYVSLCKNLEEYKAQKVKAWEQGVEEHTEAQLNKFLLEREDPSPLAEEGFVRVNFAPVLVRLLREVKYLQLLDIEVPERAALLYKKVDVYRTQTGSLDIIVSMYNDILATLLPVEKPLLADRIEKMNKALHDGIHELRWNSQGIDPFIREAMTTVSEVDELVRKMKENVRKMQEAMRKWEKPLFDRKMKPQAPEDLEQNHQSLVMPRLDEIRNQGKEIHKLMKDTADNIKPDKKAQTWLSYVDYVNGLVIEGITAGIHASLAYLADQISIPFNKLHGLPPMFDVKVDLRDREVVFDPSIQSNYRGTGIRDILQKIIDDFISLSNTLTRLDTGGSGGDYLVEIKDQFELFGAMQTLTNHFHDTEVAAADYLDQYKGKEFLWKETLEESFRAFLEEGVDPREQEHKRVNEDGEEEEDETFAYMAGKILDGVETKKPSLEAFDEKITFLTAIRDEIVEAAARPTVDIGWLRVNATPLIRELEKTANEWIAAYTGFLLDNTTREIENIEEFIHSVEKGTKELPSAAETEADKKRLMRVMAHLRDVKMIKDRTLEEIEPMKQAVLLLKKHQQSFPKDADFIIKLENSKAALVEVSERALGPIKEAILPLQTQEARAIKDRLKEFGTKVEQYRYEFQRECPYYLSYQSDESPEIIAQAYATIAEYHARTNELVDEAAELNDLETLFDMQKSSYKQLRDCRTELVLLKQMWDLISLIDYQFLAWEATTWDNIKVDELELLIKEMQKSQCSPSTLANREMKSWKAFIGLTDRVKNMGAILPLVASLHSPSMQDRHWRRLMATTGRTVNVKSPEFCLRDLIRLELHKYSEEVTELVEGAAKEERIEKKLDNIQTIWESQAFEFKEWKDVPILGALEETVEYCETHALELTGMLSSKDVEEFRERVQHWQKTLKTVEAVIDIWVKVQRAWRRLEPIFLASADIRAQLPDDTRRFEGIDSTFKEMMREAREEPVVVTACTWEGREAQLNELNGEIDMCQKALADYLGQKRKAFARFYFVSEQALLDILSNGNNPEKVDEYLGDCFDGLKSLDFVKPPGLQGPAKTAKGMHSKEREYVSFADDHFECRGPVEGYLSDLEAFIQKQLALILENAWETALQWGIDSERHIWLDNYPAQIALLATQIMWTDETGRAFDELEGGRENAMVQHLDTVKARIERLIARVRGELTPDERTKIITIITIDVHSRDTIRDFVVRKIADQQLFAWQSQLKFHLERGEKKGTKGDGKYCVVKICDWATKYNYEYVGNCGRLVITPLTDRCYITLTQALNLTMGGAPAGPAGTGKTETTKDLGRALGLQVVVFNCSDQMTYTSMALIFMGLAQSGSWGCFDEFNRISIDVLSVVSSQVKEVLDALRELKRNPAKSQFLFQGEDEIGLRSTVGFFITMNPGYAGRTELPENLKALFRSCAMVVPDIVRICENMLMAEGFSTAEDLSKKFMTLYDLAKSLLSKQIHYDWGLRAVKSVLRQAGALKRAPANVNVSEELLLKRGLRDFNWPKIVVDDREIFKGLIRDLFPGVQGDDEQVQDEAMYAAIRAEAKAQGLQAEDGSDFALKAVQLSEILSVRHSCFIIGNPGSGKTAVWKTLAGAQTQWGHETITENADPKAVTSDELFGCMNPKTKEWRDGVLSCIMRDMNKNQGRYKAEQKAKWIVLDGDVDPEWIESLNTVMDDNKVLTLVSQERIPLTPEMRLILEVSHLKNATPATVSRGGVLFINDADVGWKPYFDSWLSKYKKSEQNSQTNDEDAENVFTLAVGHYLADGFLEDLRSKGHIAPVCDMARVQSLTCILDHLYNQLHRVKAQLEHLKRLRDEGKEEDVKQLYEAFFVFAAMWALGGPLDDDDKPGFSKHWMSYSRIKYPDNGGQCFDFYWEPLEGTWRPWQDRVRVMDPHYDGLFSNLVVPTAETTRQRFLLEVHVKASKGILYVGSAGTGKTTIVRDYFSTLDAETTLSAATNFNSYTDSKALQVVVMGHVDRRAGRAYGPAPGKKLIYFMDDLNMPYVDKYGTQSPICLVRQIIDHGIVYDREHLDEQKLLQDIMFTACMNPKAGSFHVDGRLSRHFTLVSCLTAEREILKTIYAQILDAHLKAFDKSIAELSGKLVAATTTVFWGVATAPQFMPTARKFHYQFNLRDFSKIVQNLMLAQPAHYKGQPLAMARLWAHECHRVWLDRLIESTDREQYMSYMKTALKELGDFKEEEVFAEPLLYTSYVTACQGNEPAYLPVSSMADLKQVLEAKLEEYNEHVASMNLVLFDVAMEHVSRIARIVDLPVGSALLVGVGGSGKQSLAKLAAFILDYDVQRIVVTSSYGQNELLQDIAGMFQKAGVAGSQLLFLLTDTQITVDRFLVPINDLLSAGWIPELFAADELDALLSKVRAEAKANGCPDTPEQLFQFFLDKVRKNLHLGLCFSPVGDAFRFRARKFPGIISCTSLDWFHEWPREALIDVAQRFLADVELQVEGKEESELHEAIAAHMSEVHLSIADANEEFRRAERRNNYTTPTSFLELISFYKLLLGQKRGRITEQIGRLEVGLQTMAGTTTQVGELTKRLEVKMVDVRKEREKTDALIAVVGRESEAADVEARAAAAQQAEATQLTNEANAEKAKAQAELAEAVPAMRAAEAAVDCLEVRAIQELKGMGQPPAACQDVGKAVLILLKGEKKNTGWPNAQKMMSNPNKFLIDVKEFDRDNIDEWRLHALEPQLQDPDFNEEYMKSKSTAAAFLCAWVVNIAKYNSIYKKVKPLQDAAAAAQATAEAKQAELAIAMDKRRAAEEKVDELKAQLAEAVADKQRVEDEAQALQDQLDLANRLVGGLADENVRWAANVKQYSVERTTMIGDALVSAAFVSYIGPFSASFRARLWREEWLADIAERKIPATVGIDPLDVLANAADQARWKGQGLPDDRVSLENAAVVVSCNRYPLLIDPQLQGVKWIRGRETSLKAIQLSQKRWLSAVESAVSDGQVLLIEAIGEEIDAILDPLLSRQFVRKGKSFTVRLGADDVDLHESFKLYLQTKLINPHYKPETAAQCTIINFIVTESGLEDQLLAMVVKWEKPELEAAKEELVRQQNDFQITLAGLEADLLKNLTDADPARILQNTALIESLEDTKKTSLDILEQQGIAKVTEARINALREGYRRVAAEGAMQYFLLIQLCIVDHMYQYSLESFTTFFFRAMEKTEQFEEEEPRVLALRESIRMTIYRWVARGLFEAHKQIFRCQLTFRLMQKKVLAVEYTDKEMQFLLNCPGSSSPSNPVSLKEWLPDLAWAAMQKLIELEGFEQFANHVEKEVPQKFKEWYNHVTPEDERLPMDWKRLDQTPFQKMLVVRVLRPDRVTTALDKFVRKTLPRGDDYVDCDSTSSFAQVLASSYAESTTTTPLYFILSPGADPVTDVEALARSQGLDPVKMLSTIALGQGQDVTARQKLEAAHKEGHWVMLQNIHLMPAFLVELEKTLDAYAAEGSNPSFRLFLSSDPSASIPIGLLERSIKLTNEPPEGLKQNMKRAFTFFSKEDIESKEPRIRTILFALCYFHSVMLERRKFGPKGWNMRYPFSVGDLRDSAIVLNNYMESAAASGKIPWDDLKYIFGAIMYGGHIVDDWDRTLCAAFLDNLMNDALLEDDEAELLPYVEGKSVSFRCPAPLSHDKYLEHIETECPPETPLAFGLDPNAEIDFRTQQCRSLFATLQEIQPRGGGAAAGGDDLQERIQQFMQRVSDEAALEQNKLNIEEIHSKLEEHKTPYQNTFLQECEYMNALIRAIVGSLQEIELAFKGELTMTEKMEALMAAIYVNKVPAPWAKLAFQSTRGLASWLDNLRARLDQLNLWKDDPLKVPHVTFLNRLFNPQSFLTAIKQVHCQETQAELNALTICTDVLKKLYWEADLPQSKQEGGGAYVFGFQVEGARWDAQAGQLDESKPKKPFSVVPVVNCRAALSNPLGKVDPSLYMCPVYQTTARGATYVFTAQLRTKAEPRRWILAGVALILDVEGVSDAFAPGREARLPE